MHRHSLRWASAAPPPKSTADLEVAEVTPPQARHPCPCEAAVVSAALTVVLNQLRLIVGAEAAVEFALPLWIGTGLKHTQVD